jgi:hypothetical protein
MVHDSILSDNLSGFIINVILPLLPVDLKNNLYTLFKLPFKTV